MVKSFNRIIIALVFFSSATTAAFAVDGFSIAVSCSIPEVPGLNAPLVEEQAVRPIETTVQPGIKNLQEKAAVESPTMIQEDKEINVAAEKSSYVLVQTVYAR